ncbi:hypothetical protein [Natrinema soli]|uniref:Uncharacterized protein n=1 Tax=Natrinema soli TaxID=1930624 RepID=A0ABD5SKH9_9EURY|nr:hypothetical protein [Natrinema soli]
MLGLLITFIIIPIAIGLQLEEYDIDSSLFIPAFTAVIGSFGLYFLRQWRRRKRIETALEAELNQMSDLKSLPDNLGELEPAPPDDDIPAEVVPTPEALPTDVYDSNLPELSLLHSWVYRDVVGFYTQLKRHKPTLREIHLQKEEEDITMSNQEDLYREAEELKEKRSKLLRKLG